MTFEWPSRPNPLPFPFTSQCYNLQRIPDKHGLHGLHEHDLFYIYNHHKWQALTLIRRYSLGMKKLHFLFLCNNICKHMSRLLWGRCQVCNRRMKMFQIQMELLRNHSQQNHWWAAFCKVPSKLPPQSHDTGHWKGATPALGLGGGETWGQAAGDKLTN